MATETIEDIVREMREFADKQERMSIYDLRDLATETLRVYADCIEAAYKRELVPNRNKLGNKTVTDCNGLNTNPAENVNSEKVIYNAAKMCEALRELIWGWDIFINGLEEDLDGHYPANYQARRSDYEKRIHKAKSALTAPPRNCDKCLTPKDAMLAHLAEVYEGEKVEFGDYEWCEFVKWLFAEAKEEVK